MVQIHFGVGKTGAEEAGRRGDICIVVDVLRASSTIIAAFVGGIESIIPKENTSTLTADQITIGEREGMKIPGCTYGNSPIELLENRHPHQELYFVSTNGTPCILSCSSENGIVLIGALLNASAVSAVAKNLAKEHHKNISIVLAGYHNQLEDDDLITGSFIYSKHLSRFPVIGEIQPVKISNGSTSLLNCKAAKRLSRLNYIDDIKFCSQIDYTNIVPIYEPKTGKIHRYTEHPSSSN